MKIFLSAGEPSGDLHGANLIRDIKARQPDIEFVGYGGPLMAEAGCRLHENLTRYAVMLLLPVLLRLHKFIGFLRRANRYFRDNKVDAVVLIDYPGLNLRIARLAKKHNIPVFYYGAPQMWGWAGWRVRKMRRDVDHLLCKLPFEEEWFKSRGCNATYLGHPFFDQLERHKLDQGFLEQLSQDERTLVTILPGSRRQEVVKNLPWFLKSAENIRQNVSDVRFAIACFNNQHAEIARRLVEETGHPIDVFVGRTPELINAAECCMACSGSVSLELLYQLKPTVILYKINRLQWVGQALLKKVKYITLVNLLATDYIYSKRWAPFDPDAEGAEKVPFPEYLTHVDKSDWIASHIINWLSDPEQLDKRLDQLRELRDDYGSPGASEAAAKFMLGQLLAEHEQSKSAA
jgi:lipid-A-disaccharide synthase